MARALKTTGETAPRRTPKLKSDAQPRATPVKRGDGTAEREIYRSIFEAVMDRRLIPGTRLPEAVLSKLYKVSRATVRKALQELAHDHIVSLRPNQSAVVAVPTPEETRAVFEARRAVETAIIALVVQRATAADIVALRTQLQREHEAMHRFDQPAWVRLASSFHLQLAALARSPVLENYLNELVSRCSLVVSLYEPPGNATCEHEEHSGIVDCIERRDEPGAISLMNAHLDVLEKNIILDRSDEEFSLARMLGLNQGARR